MDGIFIRPNITIGIQANESSPRDIESVSKGGSELLVEPRAYDFEPDWVLPGETLFGVGIGTGSTVEPGLPSPVDPSIVGGGPGKAPSGPLKCRTVSGKNLLIQPPQKCRNVETYKRLKELGFTQLMIGFDSEQFRYAGEAGWHPHEIGLWLTRGKLKDANNGEFYRELINKVKGLVSEFDPDYVLGAVKSDPRIDVYVLEHLYNQGGEFSRIVRDYVRSVLRFYIDNFNVFYKQGAGITDNEDLYSFFSVWVDEPSNENWPPKYLLLAIRDVIREERDSGSPFFTSTVFGKDYSTIFEIGERNKTLGPNYTTDYANYADVIGYTYYYEASVQLDPWWTKEHDQRSEWTWMTEQSELVDKVRGSWISLHDDVGEFEQLLGHANNLGWDYISVFAGVKDDDGNEWVDCNEFFDYLINKFIPGAIKAGWMECWR